jgi:hypothetical protein
MAICCRTEMLTFDETRNGGGDDDDDVATGKLAVVSVDFLLRFFLPSPLAMQSRVVVGVNVLLDVVEVQDVPNDRYGCKRGVRLKHCSVRVWKAAAMTGFMVEEVDVHCRDEEETKI